VVFGKTKASNSAMEVERETYGCMVSKPDTLSVLPYFKYTDDVRRIKRVAIMNAKAGAMIFGTVDRKKIRAKKAKPQASSGNRSTLVIAATRFEAFISR
jgi:hypothetical protein